MQKLEDQVNKIRLISQTAKERIKQIVLKEALNLSAEFPKMIFGVRDNKKRPFNFVEGMIGSVEVTAYASEKEMKGIVLYDADRFWKENNIVVLTPEGLFNCQFVMSEPLSGNLIDSRPDWSTKQETPDLWIKYGELALQKLTELKKN